MFLRSHGGYYDGIPEENISLYSSLLRKFHRYVLFISISVVSGVSDKIHIKVKK